MLKEAPPAAAPGPDLEESAWETSEPEIFVVPASFAQQRLWLTDRIEPGLATYNIPFAVRLRGPLDAGVLEEALREVEARHEVLRTAFGEEEGEPVQLISPDVQLRLERIDLTDLPTAERAAAALAQVRREAERPFDLAERPLMRVALYRLEDEDHVLSFNMHHIITDAWSTGLLFRDLFALYEALLAGLPSPLPDLPLQYADYADWQRQWLQGETLELRLLPLRKRLAGAPAVLTLPTDRPRSAAVRAGGGLELFELPSGAVSGTGAAAQSLARESSGTVFMVLLAAFQALLGRLSGQDDVVVGTTVANRTRVETEGIVGFFVNTLALRAEMRGDPTFRQHLAQVREVAVEAFAHEDLPFEKLVEALRPERRLEHSPLFQAMFNFQPPQLAGAIGSPDLAAEMLEVHSGTAKFDLTLNLIEEPDGTLHGGWEYGTALFDRPTIQRLAEHFRTLLADALARPDTRLSELALLSAAERHQLRAEHNPARPDTYPVASLPGLFARQAARSPEAVAVSGEGRSLTYRELQDRAAQLARHLRAMGVVPDSLVGLCAERSPELVVGILGILEAGGAYLPLDPDYPAQRLDFMVRDAGAAVLLTQRRWASRLPALPGARVLILEDALETPAPTGVAERPVEVLPDHLAYVIYTSGSTGTPKGVQVTHAGVTRLFSATDAGFGFGAADVWTLFHSYAFDFSVWEIWGALLHGGRLVVVPYWVSRSPEAFLELLRRERVTVLSQTPSAFGPLAQLVAASEYGAPEALRLVVFGGEALSLRALRPWFERFDDFQGLPGSRGQVRLVNLYGITETTVHVTWKPLARGDAGLFGSPIGRPIPDQAVHLLDRFGLPVPLGAAGEIHVGGHGTARGYLGRPRLTAERFLPDPFSDVPGSRLYRSGDLARRLNDGQIEFLGRVDQQVKVRGFRIEPGEIEAALSAQPGLKEAAVAVRRAPSGEPVLVAYVVAKKGAAPAPRLLREFLAGKLPEYMIPATYMELAGLPRTASGKVDRNALPDPRAEVTAAGFIPPRTPIEEVLAGLWASQLRVDTIGAHDNFFDLGGHSLTATGLVAQVRATFGVELPARAVFEMPLLSELAGRIEGLLTGGGQLELPPIVAEPRTAGNIPVSFSQQRLWFLDQLAGGKTPHYNIAAPLSLEGSLDFAAVEGAIGEIVRRHEALRTTFGTGADGQPVQVIHPAGRFHIPLVDLRGLPEVKGELVRLVQEEEERPFTLSRGPLFRVHLFQFEDERHALVLNMHHVVSDAWSLEVFVRELVGLYRAFCAGRPSPLPELHVQYADFAVWQRRHLSGAALDAQLAHWTGHLAGAPTVLDLPTDHPRPAVQTYAGHGTQVDLPASLADAVRALSRKQRGTLFMTVLAAYSALLQRYTGQSDILVGTPIANRNRAETEGLIGFFVNMLVLRTDLSGRPTFRELFGRVREAALGAYAHQDLPFERLVEALQPERDLARTPLFQVTLNVTGVPWGALDLPGIRLGLLDAKLGTRHEVFDLSLRTLDLPHGLVLRLSSNAALFDRSTLDRIGLQVGALLEALANDPDLPVTAAPLLTADEQRQIAAWGGSAELAAPEAGETIVRLFEARAAEQPQAAALAFGRSELSYEELSRRSNRLARHLREQGVGPERVVAVFLEEAADFVVAMLAVWKAGGVYLPLEPGLPRERLAWMLEDTGARVAVTRGRLASNLASVPAVVRLDADAAALARRDAADLGLDPAPESLAYVLYTSGSTGQPKAVGVSHTALLAHSRASAGRLGLKPEDRVLQFAAFTFDLSLDQIVPALISGSTLVVWEPEIPGAAELARVLAEQRVTVAHLTTVVWHQAARGWAEGKPAVQAPALRWMQAGGEAMPADALTLWGKTPLAHVPLVNSYGPTEATVFATLYEADAREPRSDWDLARLPIGQPVAGYTVQVLDGEGEPAAVGAAGEIHLGGPALARGYLGRPDLTAAAFVPDPFGTPGSRLYRTGDLARWRQDGNLDFAGRRDHQIKLRGYRIEPSEVEAAILAHPEVHAAVVAVRAGVAGPGTESLVAHFVGTASGAELRDFLRDRLPSYMIPTAWVALDALPLTPTGKLDRAALPAPAAAPAAAPAPPAEAVEPEAPAAPAPAPIAMVDPVETLLADLWKELLGIPEVKPDDNFFDLGGHSLLLAILRARLTQEFGVELPMLDFFNHVTVRSLAEYLRRELGDLIPTGLSPAPAAEVAAVPAPAVPQEAPALQPAAGPVAVRADDIAIVGMAGRFPGARDVDQFWANLRDGVDGITFFGEGGRAAWTPPPGDLPFFEVPAKGVIEGADTFDAAFFGFSPREAELLDPQQRLFLETAWTAMEHAGYDAEQYPGKIGVFGGISKHDYLILLAQSGAMSEPQSSGLALLGTETDALTPRVAFELGLRGPTVNIANGCATGLVAIHVACTSLRSGECDMALAGSVSITAQHRQASVYTAGGYVSPTGTCRGFDAKGDGTIDSDGVAIVLLKRLSAALADGDRVHAVIRGSAVSNEGSDRPSVLVSTVPGRARVIREALEHADAEASSVTFVAADAAGTLMPDQIELAALVQAFAGAGPEGTVALGAVTSNIGHTNGASGVMGVLQAALALEHRQIPPTIHFESAPPEVKLQGTPLFVNTRLRDWTVPAGTPRRAGVNALGLGGVIAHAVLEEAPPQAVRPRTAPSRPWQLLVLSAKTPTALEAATANLADHLAAHPDLALADVAWTLQIGRRALPHRRIVVCGAGGTGAADAVTALRSRPEGRFRSATIRRRQAPVALVFPGVNPEATAALRIDTTPYRAEPAFRAEVERALALLRPGLAKRLREALLDGPPALIDDPDAAELALFVLQYALGRLWQGWMGNPPALSGEGTGEYAVACLTGAASLEDVLGMIAARGIQPGRFADALPRVADAPDRIALVIGPGEPQKEAVRRIVETAAVRLPVLPVTGAAGEEHPLLTLGDAWLAGAAVDWRAVHGGHPGETLRRLALPTYPFERQRYWVEAKTDPLEAMQALADASTTALELKG
jgi:amino acid adenylation domain-containing protein